jgi:replication initiation protein RepC
MHTSHVNPGMRSLSLGLIEGARLAEAHQGRLGKPDVRDLFRAMRTARDALNLNPTTCTVLEKLCACFNGDLVKGRVIVWPSNSYLESATGRSARTIRRAVSDLIALGLITPKDSECRNRYAVRGRDGRIIDAFGFDLSPLLLRRAELSSKASEQEIESKERSRFDREANEHRLATRVALSAAAPLDATGKVAALTRALNVLCKELPARQHDSDRRRVLLASAALRRKAEDLFYDLNRRSSADLAAPGGHRVRPIEKETEESTEGLKEASEEAGPGGKIAPVDVGRSSVAAAGEAFLSPGLIGEACPTLRDLRRDCRSPADFMEAGRLARPSFGASPDAWREGKERLGEFLTALLAIYVYQLADDANAAKELPLAPSKQTKFGGLFRHLIRKTASGEFSLRAALLKLRRKRMRRRPSRPGP